MLDCSSAMNNNLPLQPENPPKFQLIPRTCLGLEPQEDYELNHALTTISLENARNSLRAMMASYSGAGTDENLTTDLLDVDLLIRNAVEKLNAVGKNKAALVETTMIGSSSVLEVAGSNPAPTPQHRLSVKSADADNARSLASPGGSGSIKDKMEFYGQLRDLLRNREEYMAVRHQQLLSNAREHVATDIDAVEFRKRMIQAFANLGSSTSDEPKTTNNQLEKPEWLENIFVTDVNLRRGVSPYLEMEYLQIADPDDLSDQQFPVEGIMYGNHKRWIFPLKLTLTINGEKKSRWVLWLYDSCSLTTMISDDTIERFQNGESGWRRDAFFGEIHGLHAYYLTRSVPQFAGLNILGQDLLSHWRAKVTLEYGIGQDRGPRATLDVVR